MLRYTKEEIIEKFRKKFGDKFDYSKFEYKGINEKGCIICPEHGEFLMSPGVHLSSKTGCPICGKKQGDAKRFLTTDEFIAKATKVHNGKYDYSKVNYKGWGDYVTIICPEHGEFTQKAGSHLKGAGCAKCANVVNPVSREEFIERCTSIYGSKYAMDNIRYRNLKTMVTFTCERHGEFEMKPKTFLKGEGCPYCQKEKKFIEKATEKHGGKYDYSKVVYKNANTPVCIIDKDRGEFWQKPSNHLDGIGNNFPFDVYGYCKSVAEQYEYMYDFYNEKRACYRKCVNNGWIDDFKWLKRGKIWEKRISLVYAYELPDNHVYVGLTKNLERRDKTHRGLIDEKRKKSSLFIYCHENGIEIPEPKILAKNLTIEESSALEKKWINQYRKNGWSLINKTNGGEIGATPFTEHDKFTKDVIIDKAKTYGTLEELKVADKNLYNLVYSFGVVDECFPDRQKHRKPHVYTEQFINALVKKYPLKNDLRKNDVGAYVYFHKHGLLDKFYPKRIRSLKNRKS